MINVNLLPPEIKDEISQSKKNAYIYSYFKKTILLFLVFGLVFIFFDLYFAQSFKTYAATLAEKEKGIEKFGTVEEKSKKISERLNTISTIEKNSNIWSTTISEISSVVPNGLYLSSLKIDSSEKARNQIAGYATSKTEVAAFRDAMEKSKKFQYVDIENSTTTYDSKRKVEVESFVITFSLEKGALR